MKLGDVVLGYVLFRGANLSEAQENQMLTWGEGKYDRATVVKGLRRLDKNIHENKKKGVAYFDEGSEPDGEPDQENPESFLQEQEDSDDEDIGEGEMREIYEEEEVQEALATYQDVRKSIRDQKTGRGYYPRPGGKGQTPESSKGRGKGSKGQKPSLAFKNRDYVKFTKGGTKIHVDMLKLRTRCARCGQVGHWAKECRNSPDSRGKAASNMRSASSAPSSQSGKSGFFVTSQGDASPQSFVTMIGENNESEFSASFMSYMPTFGKFLRGVVCRNSISSEKNESGIDEAPSFVGVVTCPSQGVVDTAAQDGLIGKAALLRLMSNLRDHGLKVNWNRTKKAQACGVGGKAQVIGVAEVPLGIAGVNGLMELTVVADEIPLLLPIKLLKQLKAVVDLDENTLELRTYGVKAPLVDLPSGHVSVGVTEFAPEGWKIPHDAVCSSLKHEQFTLASNGYVNHSMIALERVEATTPSASSNHGVSSSSGADAGAEGGGNTSEDTIACCHTQNKEGSLPLEAGRGAPGRPDGAAGSARKGSNLASKLIVAALGVQVLTGGPITFYPKHARCLGEIKDDGCSVGVCRGDKVRGLRGREADEGKADYPRLRVSSPEDGAERSWEPVQTRDLLQPLQGQMGAAHAGRVEAAKGDGDEPGFIGDSSEGASLHECGANGHGGQVFMQQASTSLASEEKGTDGGPSLLPLPRSCVRFLPVGCDGAGDDPQSDGRRGGDGGEAPGRDREDPEPGGGPHQPAGPGDAASQGGAEGKDGGELPQSVGSSNESASTGDGRDQGADGLDAGLHGPSTGKPSGPSGRRLQLGERSLDLRGLPQGLGLEQMCVMSSQPQLLAGRRLQMRAFCPTKLSTPWNMSLPRSYFLWDESSDLWKSYSGWLPRTLRPSQVALACFQDQEDMAIWSQEFGKGRALTPGQLKKVNRALSAVTKPKDVQDEAVVWKLVSPCFDASVFKSESEVMANLDPLHSEFLWQVLRDKLPTKLAMFPGSTPESQELAKDVAQWQDVHGRSFVILCDPSAGVSEVENLCQGEDWVQEQMDGVRCVSNDQEMLYETFNVPEKQEAHQGEVHSFHQNQEAHQGEVHSFHQNQEAHQGEVNSFRQNQEVHQESVFEVDESQHGGSFRKCESQQGGSYMASSQLSEIEFRAQRLVHDKDYSLSSLEKLVDLFPRDGAKHRASNFGTYLAFGLYAHGKQYGVTTKSQQLPTFVRYVNELLRFQGLGTIQDQATWTTFALGLDAGALPHRDVHNRQGSKKLHPRFREVQGRGALAADGVRLLSIIENGEASEWRRDLCQRLQYQEQNVGVQSSTLARFSQLVWQPIRDQRLL